MSGRAPASGARVVAVLAMALLALVPSYFFGTLSAFAAVLAIALVLAGNLSKQWPWLGWLALVVIAGGQLAILALVLAGVFGDRALAPIHSLPSRAEIIGAHVLLQGVYITAFFAGRAVQTRYRGLVEDAISAARRAATREVLLDEARADYTRAITLADEVSTPPRRRAAAASEQITTVAVRSFDDIVRAVPEPPARESRPVLHGLDDNWVAAYQSKLRGQDAGLLAFCLAGLVLTMIAVREPVPRYFAIGGIGGIAVMVGVRAWLAYRRPDRVVAWPLDVMAVLSAGPAYGWGLHSAFAAIVATMLLLAGMFSRRHSRGYWPIAMVYAGHLAVFVALATGVLPDDSNLKVWQPGMAAATPYIQHAVLQGVFVAAYAIGMRLDRRFVEVSERTRMAIGAYARADARLHVARTEIDAAARLGEGMFTGTEVGPYRVGRLLGRGGAGEVYDAEKAGGERVRLGLIRAELIADPAAQQRFEAAARQLMRVGSHYCARPLDVGRDGELPYLVTERVEGRSLAALLHERELAPNELVGFVSDVAHGLGDIHAAGVLHLDLEPGNIVLAETAHGRRWLIVGFGISALADDAGAPMYMAPEQTHGGSIDARADLYALALILYRLVTGRPAYVGTDRAAIARAAIEHGPPAPHGATDDLALVLRIGLAAAPDDRFTSADELRAAVIAALTGRLDERLRMRGRDLVARAPWAT